MKTGWVIVYPDGSWSVNDIRHADDLAWDFLILSVYGPFVQTEESKAHLKRLGYKIMRVTVTPEKASKR